MAGPRPLGLQVLPHPGITTCVPDGGARLLLRSVILSERQRGPDADLAVLLLLARRDSLRRPRVRLATVTHNFLPRARIYDYDAYNENAAPKRTVTACSCVRT
jgi:hypothetical protein